MVCINSERHHFRLAAKWIGLFVLTLAGLCSTCLAGKKSTDPLREPPGADIFASTNIVRLSIQLSREAIATLSSYTWYEESDDDDRPEVRGQVIEGTRVYTNVAIHLKGTKGSFQAIEMRPCLTLNFSKFAEGQTFHGLKKISLNNSKQDASFMGEKISRELCAAAGLPAPRSDYAVVTLNKRKLGLYVLVEGYNKQFLHRHFKDVSGNFYDSGYARDVSPQMKANSGENPTDHSDLVRLRAAAREASRFQTLEPLTKVLDLDRFYTFLVMENMLCHWDSYSLNRNNYRLFHDMETDRMVFLPHGMDQVFGIGRRGDPGQKILTHCSGSIAAIVLAIPKGREKYLERFAELRTKIYDVETLTQRVKQLNTRLRPILEEFRPGKLHTYDEAVGLLRHNIAERGRSLEDELVPKQPK